MQNTGYVIVNNEKILILERQPHPRSKNPRWSLKFRKSGKDGEFLKTHSEYLSEYPNLVQKLQKGEVITM